MPKKNRLKLEGPPRPSRLTGHDLPRTLYVRLFFIVRNAIARCTNPDWPRYADYGGRGINVHRPWLEDKTKFIDYLCTLPGHDDRDLVLDRTNNNKGYRPGNLRFVTRSESQFNRRRFSHRLKRGDDGRFIKKSHSK